MATNNTPSSSESDPERRVITTTESARHDKLLKRLKPYWMMEGANVFFVPFFAWFLITVVADHAANKEDAPRLVESMLTCYEKPAIPPTELATPTASPAPGPAPPLPLRESLKPDGKFSLLDGKFVATTSEIKHQRIKSELARYREFGFKSLDWSVEVFCGPNELSWEGLKWKIAETQSPIVWSIATLDRS